MNFIVNFYTFTKEVNSTARPSGSGTACPCVSNADFNILAPRLPLQLGAAANPTGFNYCYVDAWGRYYWISRWAFEAGLWVAYCEVDALASWKTEIGATSAYVLRAAADSDGSIIDTMYPIKSDSTCEIQAGTSPWTLDPTQGTFVVGIAGSGATQYLRFTKAGLDTFFQSIFNDSYAQDCLNTLALATNPELKVQLNPLQYITSIIWLPFSSAGDAVNTIRVGLADVAIAGMSIGSGHASGTSQFNIRRHPQADNRGSWLNAGAASYDLFYPPFGLIHLDPVQCASNSTIYADWKVDYKTGHATLTVTSESGMLAQVSGQVGLSYSVGNVVSPGWGLSSMLSQFGGIAAAAVSQNWGGVISGALGAVGSAAAAAVPHLSTVGGASASDGLIGNPSVIYEWFYPAPEDNAHRGRPLCQVRQLSTLSGYQLCTDTDIQIPATRQEIDTIRAYLESGYYYE